MTRVVAALILLGASMAQTPAPVARDGVMTGQVVDAASGRPIGAAVVSIGGTSTVRTSRTPSTSTVRTFPHP